MAHSTATISFHVYYDSDTDVMPSDEELLEAYQKLEEYVHEDSVLVGGAHQITFEIGGQGGECGNGFHVSSCRWFG